VRIGVDRSESKAAGGEVEKTKGRKPEPIVTQSSEDQQIREKSASKQNRLKNFHVSNNDQSNVSAKVVNSVAQKETDTAVDSRFSLPVDSEPLNVKEDCSVPMSSSKCCSSEQQLKIQVSVGEIDSLEEIIVDRNRKGRGSYNKQSSDNKYERNSKMALNYLFHKLGDSYPKKPQKRLLLKTPTFVDYSSSQFGEYYSGLPKLLDAEGSNVPAPIVYNAALSKGPPDAFATKQFVDHELSDSDVSIADSLEESQQLKTATTETTKGRNNQCKLIFADKYRKHDDKLARGDVARNEQEPTERTVGNSISYFLHFLDVENSLENNENVQQEVVDEHYVPPHIPIHLLEKLNRRSNSISKHSSCLATTTTTTTSNKNRGFVHKQIQTCFNARESLRRKRRTRVGEPTLDKRIASILMTGLKIQEEKKSSSEVLKSDSCTTTVTPQTDRADDKISKEGKQAHFEKNEDVDKSAENGDIILREEEIERISSSSLNYYRAVERSKKFRYPTEPTNKGKNVNGNFDRKSVRVSNFPQYHYQEKLKYFKERKIRKQREGECPRSETASADEVEANDKSVDSRVLSTRKSTLSLEKKNFRGKNGRPKAKIPGSRGVRRFRQKFEAIPEEASSLSERHDVNGNYVKCDDKPIIDDIADTSSSKAELENEQISPSRTPSAPTHQGCSQNQAIHSQSTASSERPTSSAT
jgi:hypothetical protein